MSQSPFSKTNTDSNLSFQEILEGFSEEKPHEYTTNSPNHLRTNFEWTSIEENTILLNNLFEHSLQTNIFPSGNGYQRYAAHIRQSAAHIRQSAAQVKNESGSQAHPEPHVNKSSQENVPQPKTNPLWNTLIQTAFEKINAPEIISLNTHQQPLPVFFTGNDLKKIYRQRAKITHPDQTTGSHLQFIELKKNYQILMDFLKKID